MVERYWGGSLPLLLGWNSYLCEDGFPTVDVKFNTRFTISGRCVFFGGDWVLALLLEG